MSYARVSSPDSDVYVIDATHAGLTCFGPSRAYKADHLHPETVVYADTRSEMIVHLAMHLANGDKVPKRAFKRLAEELHDKGER